MEEKEQKNMENNLGNSNKKKVVIAAIVLLLLVIIVVMILLFNRRPNHYNVMFESNGGSLIETITVSENGTITKPQDPIKDNYRFVGWYYNNELYDFSKTITNDIKLDARWESIEKESTGITLKQKELKLQLGDVSNLMDTIIEQKENDENIILESSNPDIVSIDSNGNIKALKEGNVVITVKTRDGKYTAKLTITVNATDIDDTVSKEETVNVTGVSLNRTTLTLTEGQTLKLTATVKPSNAKNKNVTWKSSNSNIVTVDSKGNIKALNAGSATITVTTTDGKYTAKVTITVTEVTASTPTTPETPTVVNVAGVTLNTTVLNLTEGENSKLTATVKPSNATNKNITWVSSNTSVVSVDSSGNLKALKAGTATITVTTQDGNYKASCQITVKEKAASYSVIFTPIVQDGTGAIFQYSVAVTKNNSPFSAFSKIIYNNEPVGKYLQSTQYKPNVNNAKIILEDGSQVNATVIYR